MYFLAHLLIGILLGILLNYVFQDQRLIFACALGCILPDLIDKPVGIFFLHHTLGYGRIYCHTLLFASLIILIGVAVFTQKRSMGIVFIALGSGILTHQILDVMWLEPVSWFWPTFGEFVGRSRQDFFSNAFWNEITNPYEWFAAGSTLIFTIIYIKPEYRERFLSLSMENKERLQSPPLALFTIMISLLITILILLIGGMIGN